MGGCKRSYHFHSNKTARLVNLPRSSFDKNSWSIIPGYIQSSQEFIKKNQKKKRDMENHHILQKKIVANFVLNLAFKKKNFGLLPHLGWTECQWSTWTIRDLVSPVQCVTSWRNFTKRLGVVETNDLCDGFEQMVSRRKNSQ